MAVIARPSRRSRVSSSVRTRPPLNPAQGPALAPRRDANSPRSALRSGGRRQGIRRGGKPDPPPHYPRGLHAKQRTLNSDAASTDKTKRPRPDLAGRGRLAGCARCRERRKPCRASPVGTLEGPWRNPCVPGLQCGRRETAAPERPPAVCHVGVAVGPAVAATTVSPASGSSISSHHSAKPVAHASRHPTAVGTRAAAAMTPASGTAASWPITELWESRRESRTVPLPQEPGPLARRLGRSSRRLPGGSGHSFTVRTRWKPSIRSMTLRRARWKSSGWARI